MSTLIRSIPTIYHGVLFRSRLEARWAEAFDRRGIAWMYEEDSYDLGGGVYYLPDFLLPRLRTYVEVKGILDDEAERKPRALARATVLNQILVVLAHVPAGERWAVVADEGALDWHHGINVCDASGLAQFFDADGACRCCEREPERPWEPPYRGERLARVLRWWAWHYARKGRMAEAGEFIEAAVRLQEAP